MGSLGAEPVNQKKKMYNRNPKLTAVWMLIMVVFIGELFCYAWCRVQCIRIGYEITKESQQCEKLIRRQKNLKIELARLKSPNRIARIASKQLGLVMPTAENMIVIP